ncbi:MAG: hypothetical protein HC849_28885 [Oscillatoriales cyanobacterium RU_3_3]|nr:hypothetical protein [Microcoleus sp. SU_5_6]NJL66782.1 hypothetical protein [Microcoleus sp. SM1_3_4]NJM63284.1 hypothetical protein [Oscillatoriales cyanobacterium RU_3_3]NJR25750.1 hypothetical protein [Richelia sp. CSU_2_1]
MRGKGLTAIAIGIYSQQSRSDSAAKNSYLREWNTALTPTIGSSLTFNV